jgi:predicted transposase YdaD
MEKGMEKGKAEGRAEGRAEGISVGAQRILELIKKGLSPEDAYKQILSGA